MSSDYASMRKPIGYCDECGEPVWDPRQLPVCDECATATPCATCTRVGCPAKDTTDEYGCSDWQD